MRLGTGGRLNVSGDPECCCGGGGGGPGFDCYACQANAPAQVSVTVAGVTGSGCTTDSCAAVVNATYVLDYIGTSTSSLHCGASNSVCIWELDIDYTTICEDDPVFGNDHEIYGAELMIGECDGTDVGMRFALKVKRASEGEGCCFWMIWRDTDVGLLGEIDCTSDAIPLAFLQNAEACTANTSTATVDFGA